MGGCGGMKGHQPPLSVLVNSLLRALTSCSSTEGGKSAAPGKHWEDLQVLMHGSDRDCREEKVLVP